ncbi:MAG TPA: methyltransferase domain-containing protein [Candidatus Binatia bacterium]|nr:methyltransferase domain-containing protein [Candidatus Binatia bacterium]
MTNRSSESSDPTIDWESSQVVDQWSRNQAVRDESIGPATERMLDLAGLQNGHRVLDLAAGTGGQSLLAARRVGSTGYVLATDISAAMLNAAAEAAQRAGLANIETRVMNAERLDLGAESFDAVICRFALMLFSEPSKVLREVHRVLKRGGKCAALVFSTEEKNPYQGIPFVIVRRMGGKTGPHFSLGNPQRLRDIFRDAGFHDITVNKVSVERHFASAVDAIRRLRDAIFIRQPMAKLVERAREQAWAEIEFQLKRLEGPSGLDLSGEFLIGVGTK